MCCSAHVVLMIVSHRYKVFVVVSFSIYFRFMTSSVVLKSRADVVDEL